MFWTALVGLLMHEQTLDLSALDTAIRQDPKAAATMIRQRIKQDELNQGANPVDSDLKVLFAIQVPGEHKVSVLSDGKPLATLTTLGDGLYASIATLTDGDGFLAAYEVDGAIKRDRLPVEVYEPNPAVQTPPGGRKGELRAMGEFKSAVYPGTTRQWYVYLPPNLDASKAYPLLIAQDAQWDREWIANGLENCAQTGRIPATVGVFIEPGQNEPGKYTNRSAEYDPLSPTYTKMLLDEILPKVEKIAPLSKDPAQRAITGMSSGGICSFNACWERPDQFGVAISFIGSFANIASGPTKREGGHNFPFLVRKTDKKPIRVFLQDGSNDLDNDHGNWWICNQQMASALKFKGYDVVWVPGKGFHSTKHARRVFDQALEWWLGKAR